MTVERALDALPVASPRRATVVQARQKFGVDRSPVVAVHLVPRAMDGRDFRRMAAARRHCDDDVPFDREFVDMDTTIADDWRTIMRSRIRHSARTGVGKWENFL